jgi:Zn-dependent M28 family amino/carboxypeptidase
MRLSKLLAASVAALSISAASLSAAAIAQTGQPVPAPAPAPASGEAAGWQTELGFTPEAFRSHVTFLADDLFEGREAGTRGHELAARYVATQLAGLGLQPGNGDSWYQQVTLGRSTPGGDAQLTINGQSFPANEAYIFRPAFQSGPVNVENAETVYVGWGIDAPAHGHDSYRGLDVRGKVVVMLGGLPQGLASDVSAHLGAGRMQMAAARGAIGAIMLRPPSAAQQSPLSNLRPFATRPSTTWVNEQGRAGAPHEQLGFTLIADAPVAEALFAGSRRTWAQIAANPTANVRGFPLRQRISLSRSAEATTITTPNVVGIIPGSDPALANEYVLLMAHLDGVGIVPEGGDHQPNATTGQGSEDRIRNGAMDNTTGIATLIEVARQFMQPNNRPRRPILIAAVTAEEKGLLGASYMAANPVVDGRIVGLVNLDMPILTYDFQDVIAFGAEHSEMGPMVGRAAEAMDVRLSADPLPEQGLFTRSDPYPFVQAGVPAVFLMTGFANGGEERFRSFLGGEYHSVRDDLNLPFNWRAGARFAELNYRIAQELANAQAAPRWYRGSFFGDTLGGDQPRAERPAPAPAP